MNQRLEAAVATYARKPASGQSSLFDEPSDPEFEKLHPRDADDGRFTEKPEGGAAPAVDDKPSSPRAEEAVSKPPTFQPHPVATHNPDDFETIHADTTKLDAAWSQEKIGYLPKSHTDEKTAGVDELLKSGEPIEQPHVVMNSSGKLAFEDGRHRARALMNRGEKTIPLTVPKEDADAVRKLVSAGSESATASRIEAASAPQRQSGLFSQADMGRAPQLFDTGKEFVKPSRSEKPKPVGASLLEKIGDELKAKSEERKSLTGQRELPERTVDTMSDAISMASPNGRVSQRTKDATSERLRVALFGQDGLAHPSAKQETEVENLRRNAKQLRELADRGMGVRKNRKAADEMDAKADSLAGQKTIEEQSNSLAETKAKEPHEMTWQSITDAHKNDRESTQSRVISAEAKHAAARAGFDASFAKDGKRIKAISAKISSLNPTGDIHDIDSASQKIVNDLTAEWDSLSKRRREQSPPQRSDFIAAEFPRYELPSGQHEHRNLVAKAISEGKIASHSDYPELSSTTSYSRLEAATENYRLDSAVEMYHSLGSHSHDAIKAAERAMSDLRSPSKRAFDPARLGLIPGGGHDAIRAAEAALNELRGTRKKIAIDPARLGLVAPVNPRDAENEARKLRGLPPMWEPPKPEAKPASVATTKNPAPKPARQPGDGTAGWQRVGGAPAFVDGNGRITKGCAGLKGEHVSDLIDEGDDSRHHREVRQSHAEARGLSGKDLTAQQAKRLATKPLMEQHDAAKSVAKQHGVSKVNVLKSMPDATEMHKAMGQQTDAARKTAAKMTGLTPSKISRIENAYKDHSTVFDFDTHSRELAGMHPELGFDPDDHDTPAKVWELLKAGKIKKVGLDQIAQLAAEMVGKELRKKPLKQVVLGDADDSFDGNGGFDPDKFSRIDAAVMRYSGQGTLFDEDKHERAPKGNSKGGQFVALHRGYTVPEGGHVQVGESVRQPGEWVHTHEHTRLNVPKPKDAEESEDETLHRTGPSRRYKESLVGRDPSVEIRHADGSPLTPEEAEIVKDLKPLPGWSDLRLAHNGAGEPVIIGKDAKGRPQRTSPPAAKARRQAVKSERLPRFLAHRNTVIRPQVLNDIHHGTGQTREAALVAHLMDHTGMRIGSEKDTGADVEATGATTMDASHVTFDGDTVHMDFVGKSGHKNHWELNDPTFAAEMRKRVEKGGKIFNISDVQFRKYMGGIAPGFKPAKDFRTAVANEHAASIIGTMPVPETAEEYRDALLKVSESVATRINNTPDVAFESYILPEVFRSWQAHLIGRFPNIETLKPSSSKADQTGKAPTPEPMKSSPPKARAGGTTKTMKMTPKTTEGYSRLERAMSAFQYARHVPAKGQGELHWVTLESGTHVELDGDGDIHSGPDALVGKNVSRLDKASSTAVDKTETQPNNATVASAGDAGVNGKTGDGEMETTAQHVESTIHDAIPVGEHLAKIQDRISEVPEITVRVEHSKGYSGKRSARSYFAKIDGLDDKFGFSREFRDADNVDWGDSQMFKRSKGTWHHEHKIASTGGVFEHSEYGERDYRVYYPIIKNGSPMLAKKSIDETELKSSMKLLANADMGADDLVSAMSDSQGSTETIVERVRRWTRSAMNLEVKNDFQTIDDIRDAIANGDIVGRSKGYIAAMKRAVGDAT